MAGCKFGFSILPINRGRVIRAFPVVFIGIMQTGITENRHPGAWFGSCRLDRAQLDSHNIIQPFCCYGNNFYVVVNYRPLLPCTTLFNARTQKTIYESKALFVNAPRVDRPTGSGSERWKTGRNGSRGFFSVQLDGIRVGKRNNAYSIHFRRKSCIS